jgi:Kyakuja-Dileera-Zisupton transposase
VVDGNFSAEHLKMSRAEKDVTLSNGMGYMVEENTYRLHLAEGSNIQEVSSLSELHSKLTPFQKSTCSNHRAVSLANTHSNLESTGIGACACSRHGCFIPHSVVDFQKGERYV